MSYVARLAVSVVALAAACSSSKAPEGRGAEAPVAAEPTGAAEPAGAVNGASPSSIGDGRGSAPAASPAPQAAEVPEVATLFVGDTPADCQAEGARKCLMIRGSEDEQWRRFYGLIEGFEYEPSYAYELRVEVTDVPNPPPDAPSIHYKVVGVVSKKKTAP